MCRIGVTAYAQKIGFLGVAGRRNFSAIAAALALFALLLPGALSSGPIGRTAADQPHAHFPPALEHVRHDHGGSSGHLLSLEDFQVCPPQTFALLPPSGVDAVCWPRAVAQGVDYWLAARFVRGPPLIVV
jgi:hypothetical protein